MFKGWMIQVLVMFLMGAPAVPLGQQQAKPVVVELFHMDRDPAPGSLDEMWRRAGAVMIVKIIRAASRPAPPDPMRIGSRLGPDKTRYDGHVIEVLSNVTGRPVRVRRVVSILREMGDTDEGDRVVRRVDRDFPAFVVGHSYLLFLNWNEYARLFVVAYGPDASYDIVNGRIQTAGHGAVAGRLDGQRADQLLDKLRAMAKERRR